VDRPWPEAKTAERDSLSPPEDPTTLELLPALRRLGYEAFRRGQREAIEALLRRRRLLLVAPTGGGKSLTYQLPASLLPGTTLVVSPLISLMVDQVAALEARGVPSTYLASTLNAAENRHRLARLARGDYKLVYVAPERLGFEGFRAVLSRLACPLVAVDEAHCISEWGHDFRPEYLALDRLLASLPDARVLACTATATPIVRDEILDRLGLPPDTPQIVQGFARPNLALRVADVPGKRRREQEVDAALGEALSRPGSGRGTAIVYSPTRRATEDEASRLGALGWRAGAYHAGLDAATRDRVQLAFLEGSLEIVVATNAFGMGIDRPDVRAVIHLAPPGSIEAYYQEVGRAGRDGKDALGLLLLTPSDLPLRRRLLEMPVEGRDPDPEVVRHKWNLFLELMRWAEGGSCRHDAILRYFGDEEETLAGCGRCDVCLELADAPEENAEEVSVVVRKALSAIARIHGRFGLTTAAKLLKGAGEARLEQTGLAATKTFGALSDRPEEWITRVLRRTVAAGWVDFEGGDRPVVVLTEDGREVLHARRPARLLLPPRHTPKRKAREETRVKRSGEAGTTAPVSPEALDGAAYALFEALRRHRLELARKQAVPPYVVASDRTLREIAHARPRTLEDLALIHGIGPAKLERYGEEWLAIVAGE